MLVKNCSYSWSSTSSQPTILSSRRNASRTLSGVRYKGKRKVTHASLAAQRSRTFAKFLYAGGDLASLPRRAAGLIEINDTNSKPVQRMEHRKFWGAEGLHCTSPAIHLPLPLFWVFSRRYVQQGIPQVFQTSSGGFVVHCSPSGNRRFMAEVSLRRRVTQRGELPRVHQHERKKEEVD